MWFAPHAILYTFKGWLKNQTYSGSHDFNSEWPVTGGDDCFAIVMQSLWFVTTSIYALQHNGKL